MLSLLKNGKSWLYLVFGSLTIVWIIIYFVYGGVGYIAAFAVCIGMSLFSIYDFRDIFYLKEQIEVTENLNNEFDSENEKLKESVKTIGDVNQKLEKLTVGFAENNRKLSQNITNLEQFVKAFEEQKGDITDNQTKLFEQCKSWIHEWREEAADNVRRVLNEAFKAVDIDGQKGLDTKEYKAFLNSLPDDYREKITKKYKTFEQIDSALNRDGNIDRQEFSQLMNDVCSVKD